MPGARPPVCMWHRHAHTHSMHYVNESGKRDWTRSSPACNIYHAFSHKTCPAYMLVRNITCQPPLKYYLQSHIIALFAGGLCRFQHPAQLHAAVRALQLPLMLKLAKPRSKRFAMASSIKCWGWGGKAVESQRGQNSCLKNCQERNYAEKCAALAGTCSTGPAVTHHTRHSGLLFTQRVIICSVRAGCVYAAMCPAPCTCNPKSYTKPPHMSRTMGIRPARAQPL